MKKKIITLMVLSVLMISGCGTKESFQEQTSADKNDVVTTEETTEVTTTEEATTEEPKREGTRSNPFLVGDDVDMHFFGYTIQEYGDVNGKLVDYSAGTATFEYTLKSFGNENPLYFPVEFMMNGTTFSEKNQHIYVYPCDDPKLFSVSDVESFYSDEDKAVPCGETVEVNYKVGDQKYLAVVWYTMSSDGGDKDFVDQDLNGHIAFFDLQN